jgi:ketosteroid isomerase-like protein
MPTVLGLTNSPSHTTPSQSPAPAGTSSHKMGGNGRLDTISKRNHHAAREVETLFWRALCDSPEHAKEYMAKDCIMINPLFGGSSKPMSKDTEPSIEQILEGCEPWTGFRFHGEPLVVEIDLMAVALVYKVTLFKARSKGGVREVAASVSSSWRQTAGADWLLCAQHVQFCEDEEEE